MAILKLYSWPAYGGLGGPKILSLLSRSHPSSKKVLEVVQNLSSVIHASFHISKSIAQVSS